MKSFLLTLLFCTTPLLAIEGIYEGSIKLYQSNGAEVPLQVSLSFTGERVFTPRGDERPVIDATILVDSEGGPYPAANVDLDVDDSEIDIRYDRPKSNLTETSPSNFRLIGKLKGQGLITGKVLSGTKGPVGTFTLRKARAFVLSPKIVYKGSWKGQATTTGGSKVNMEVRLTPTQDSTVNPADYEFEYTLGKVASIKWNRTLLAFDRVFVDYLRRSVYIFKSNERGQSGVSLRFQIQNDGSIKGVIDSSLRGRMGEFTLRSTTEKE